MKKILLLLFLIGILSSCQKEPEIIEFDLSDVYFNYSIRSDFDLVIKEIPREVSIDSIDMGETMLAVANYSIGSNQLAFLSSYLTDLSVGEYRYTVHTSEGVFNVDINIIDTDRPYMISNSNATSDFTKDLTFTYELFGGIIESLSGNDIGSGDYVINGNQVTISKNFVRSAFEADPDMETLLIGYTLRNGSQVVLGYIFITQIESVDAL